MTKSVAIINSSSSFDSSSAREALDAAMIYGSYEQQVALFFIGDGVFQTQENQQPALLATKDFLATFGALSFYDIEQEQDLR